MASSGASPRRRAAAGPSVRGEPLRAQSPRRARGRVAGEGSDPPHGQPGSGAAPRHFCFPRRRSWCIVGVQRAAAPPRRAPPAPTGSSAAWGRGDGAAAEGHRWHRPFSVGEQRGTILGSRSERYPCPQPGLVAAVPGLALLRPPIVPQPLRAAVRAGWCGPRVPSPRCSGIPVSSSPLVPKSELHDREGPCVQAAVGHRWCRRQRSEENKRHSV
ncbi:uncharacterized protein LOC110402565 [Numida meleagris]|uniref:uncharacterized protein LOC110402565 n=1 Tax=Numida meleagris TaxID=8996 RepID=UPI000B3E160A|nr:uncharacterized protein LOC110402565 [Numida meleagris]